MNIVIIGGGPAGMLAAIAASNSYKGSEGKVKKPSQVMLIEKNEKLGKKLFITGKGRCNLTNDCDKNEFLKNIVSNRKFLYSAYSEFSNEDLKQLVEDNGCHLKVERGNRVFPVSDKSYDVIDALKKSIKDAGVKVVLNTEVKSISQVNGENPYFVIRTSGIDKIIADKVIIATGGLSYQSTGSTGDGYKFAESFSINVIKQTPSLVPFEIKEVSDCKLMQGLTLKNVGIKVFNKNFPKKNLYEDFGELLFTHFGVSGPIILSASCYVDDFDDLELSIDLKPALTVEKLDDRILREFDENRNKLLKSVIEKLLPKSMVDVFLERLDTCLENENMTLYDKAYKPHNFIGNIKVSDTNKQIRKMVVDLLKNFTFTIIGKRGFDEAIVTKGGVDAKELNPKTMESKKIKGLYFAGEVIDIDALTGGFNIQIACSTGFVAGKYSCSI